MKQWHFTVLLTGMIFWNVKVGWTQQDLTTQPEWIQNIDIGTINKIHLHTTSSQQTEVYVYGLLVGPEPGFFVRKYDSSGGEIWTHKHIEETADQFRFDKAIDFEVDSDGNAYVLWRNSLPNDKAAWILINFGHEGKLLKRTSYVTGVDDKPADLAINKKGEVFVAGTVRGKPRKGRIRPDQLFPNNDILVLKFTKGLKTAWKQPFQFDSRYLLHDQAIGLDVDHQGNVYIAGDQEKSTQYVDTEDTWNGIVLKIDSKGKLIWERTYFSGIKSETSGTEERHPIHDIKVNPEKGDVVVTGVSNAVSILTHRYNMDGALIWSDFFLAGFNPSIRATLALEIVNKELASVYVAGKSQPPGGSYYGPYDDFATIKYKGQGELSEGKVIAKKEWQAFYKYPSSDPSRIRFSSQPSSLALDAQGNVYVTGFSRSGYNVFYPVVTYDQNGSQRGEPLVQPGEPITFLHSEYKFPPLMEVDLDGNIYLAANKTLLKYSAIR